MIGHIHPDPLQGYNYFDEVSAAWPPASFRSLLASPLRLPTCPTACAQSFAPRVRDGETILRLASVGDKASVIVVNPAEYRSSSFQPCPLDGWTGVIYLAEYPLDVSSPPLFHPPPHQGSQPLYSGYRPVAPGCEYRHAANLYADHSPCLASTKKVLFWGDSHARFAILSLMWRLDGFTMPLFDHDKGKTLGIDGGQVSHFVKGHLGLDYRP